jgi:hypothetical protein
LYDVPVIGRGAHVAARESQRIGGAGLDDDRLLEVESQGAFSEAWPGAQHVDGRARKRWVPCALTVQHGQFQLVAWSIADSGLEQVEDDSAQSGQGRSEALILGVVLSCGREGTVRGLIV